MNELEAILHRATKGPLSPEDLQKLHAAMETLGWLQNQLRDKDTSLTRLRKLLFETPKTEKTSEVLGEATKKDAEGKEGDSEDLPQAGSDAAKHAPTPKGHGRHGADAYPGAKRLSVAHESLKAGDPCPEEDCEGNLYRLPEPRVLVSIRGQVPLEAAVYEREALRCALCGNASATTSSTVPRS